MSYQDVARDAIKRLESCVLTTRADVGGVPTNGYGNTGPGVVLGQTITQDQANYDLERNLATAIRRVKLAVRPGAFAALSDHQRAAVVVFVFNAGVDVKDQIWKDINAQTPDGLADVPHQLRRFDHAKINGKLVVVHGLDNRRQAECVIWATGDTVLAGQIMASAPIQPPSSAVTRDDPNFALPRPAPAKAMPKTSLGLKIGTLVTSGGAMLAKTLTPDNQQQVQSLHDTVQAHVSVLGHFGPAAVSVCSAAVICCAVGALIVHAEQIQAAKH